jgi:hypothetical protein
LSTGTTFVKGDRVTRRSREPARSRRLSFPNPCVAANNKLYVAGVVCPQRHRQAVLAGRPANPRLRKSMIELAWLWLRYQPDSAPSRWFLQRVSNERGRSRRIAIVAPGKEAAGRAVAPCHAGRHPGTCGDSSGRFSVLSSTCQASRASMRCGLSRDQQRDTKPHARRQAPAVRISRA